MTENDSAHFMEHPDIPGLVRGSLEMMRLESDRGAVLIATEIISSALKNLFEKILPHDYGEKRREELLSYPSALGSLSGKADLAYAVQIIKKDVYHSITLLRRLRNIAAHSDQRFSLSDHKSRLEEILNVGEGGNYFATSSAYKIISVGLYESLASNKDIENKLGKKPFSDWAEFIDYMKNNEQFISMVEDQAPRVSLNVGVTIICGLIMYQRDDYLKRITDA